MGVQEIPIFNRLVEILVDRYIWPYKRSDAGPGGPGENAKPRVVVVLGAAASLSSGLPLWTKRRLKEEILGAAELTFARPNLFLREAWARLAPTIGLDNPAWSEPDRRKKLLDLASLDMICSVAYEYAISRQEIIRELQARFAPKDSTLGPAPQLGYELLAHLLKHRFIDDVVTFNFDEVLDNAVLNELGEDACDRITSEHQVLPESPSEDQPENPHLIKLHGTIGLPSTLRFTRDRTSVLSPAMIDLLDRVLIGPACESPGRRRPVHIISLGYSWRDPDFVNWVKSRQDYIDSLTVVTRQNSDVRLLRESRNLESKLRVLCAAKLVAAGEPAPSVDLFVWALWKGIDEKLGKEKYPVMPAARHLILAYLFGPADPNADEPDRFHNKHDREHRFQAEMLLHLLECKGMVNLSVMARDCRLNRYLPDRAAGLALRALERLGFLERSTFPDVRETYFAKAETVEGLANELCDLRRFDHGRLRSATFDGKSGLIRYDDIDGRDFIRGVNRLTETGRAEMVFKGPEIEVVPRRDPRPNWLFEDPKPLDTYFELRMKTRELLGRSWTHLLSIAETGAWLYEEEMMRVLQQHQGRHILCVEVSKEALEQWHLLDVIAKDLTTKRHKLSHGTGCALLSGKIAWWKHNRHLTVAFDGDQGAFAGGVYFRRRLKTTQISPVYLEEQGDCAELLVTFLSHVRRVAEEILAEKAAAGQQRGGQEMQDFQRMMGISMEIGTQVMNGLQVAADERRKDLIDRIRELLERLKKYRRLLWPGGSRVVPSRE